MTTPAPNLIAPLPTVKVGGKTYSVKYAHAAIYLLSTWGIDISRIFQTLSEAYGSPATETTPEIVPNGRRTEIAAKIAAAGLGTVDGEGIWRSAQMTPLDLSERVSDEEAVEVDRVTWEAFAKKIGLPLTTTKPVTAAGAPVVSITANPFGAENGPSEPQPPVSD